MTRLTFTTAALREQIAERHKRRVALAIAAYDDAIDLPKRRAEWRATQERRVKTLARSVKDVADRDLEGFSIPSAPTLDRYKSPDVTRDDEVAKADASRDNALRRLDALHAPEGTVSLTANMLRDYFGL